MDLSYLQWQLQLVWMPQGVNDMLERLFGVIAFTIGLLYCAIILILNRRQNVKLIIFDIVLSIIVCLIAIRLIVVSDEQTLWIATILLLLLSFTADLRAGRFFPFLGR